DEAVIAAKPGNGPFDRTMAARARNLADKRLDRHLVIALKRYAEVIDKTAGEVQYLACRCRVFLADEQGGAVPAYLDATEEIGLGARHLVEALWNEMRVLAEDFRIGVKGNFGAAPVVHAALIFKFRLR